LRASTRVPRRRCNLIVDRWMMRTRTLTNPFPTRTPSSPIFFFLGSSSAGGDGATPEDGGPAPTLLFVNEQVCSSPVMWAIVTMPCATSIVKLPGFRRLEH
jgi:hypothetical protein